MDQADLKDLRFLLQRIDRNIVAIQGPPKPVPLVEDEDLLNGFTTGFNDDEPPLPPKYRKRDYVAISTSVFLVSYFVFSALFNCLIQKI